MKFLKFMNKSKNLYFLHIPKAGGRYIYYNICSPIEDILMKNNIKIDVHHSSKIRAHQFWNEDFIKNDTYILSNFRDPAKQIVSFYCHIKFLNSNGILLKDSFDGIDSGSMFNWVENNLEIISNYQSKNFLTTLPENKNMDDNLLSFNVDKQLLNERLNRLNLFLKIDNIKDKNLSKITNKILLDLNIKEKVNNKTVIKKETFENIYSKKLFESLSKKDKELLYNISSVDSEVYNTNKYFWSEF